MTAQDVINIAYSRSKRAQQGSDATPQELLVVLNETISRYVTMGVTVNRSWFMQRESVTWESDGWPRPEKAEMVWDVRDSGGGVIKRVPFDDLEAEPDWPAVYEMGGVYYPVPGRSGPSAGDRLVFYCAVQPEPISSAEEELPARWPKGHETLLGLELGIFLAQKDGRDGHIEGTPNDVAALTAQRDMSAQRFVSFLQHADVGTVRRKGSVRKAVPGMVQ